MSDLFSSSNDISRENVSILSWANNFLSQRRFYAKTLLDYEDGVLLINLIEISLELTFPKYKITPKLPVHKIENVSLCLEYMRNKFHSVTNITTIDAQDIVQNKKIKEISSLLWAVAKQHVFVNLIKQSLEEQKSLNKSINFKETLCAWWQANFLTQDNVTIDCWNSFKSGEALAKLIEKLRPKTIDNKSINPTESLKTLEYVLNTAEKTFKIPPVLTPVEMQQESAADESKLVNYLALLVSSAFADKDEAPSHLKCDMTEVLAKQQLIKESQPAAITGRGTVSSTTSPFSNDQKLQQENLILYQHIASLKQELEINSQLITNNAKKFNQLESEVKVVGELKITIQQLQTENCELKSQHVTQLEEMKAHYENLIKQKEAFSTKALNIKDQELLLLKTQSSTQQTQAEAKFQEIIKEKDAKITRITHSLSVSIEKLSAQKKLMKLQQESDKAENNNNRQEDYSNIEDSQHKDPRSNNSSRY